MLCNVACNNDNVLLGGRSTSAFVRVQRQTSRVDDSGRRIESVQVARARRIEQWRRCGCCCCLRVGLAPKRPPLCRRPADMATDSHAHAVSPAMDGEERRSERRQSSAPSLSTTGISSNSSRGIVVVVVVVVVAVSVVAATDTLERRRSHQPALHSDAPLRGKCHVPYRSPARAYQLIYGDIATEVVALNTITIICTTNDVFLDICLTWSPKLISGWKIRNKTKTIHTRIRSIREVRRNIAMLNTVNVNSNFRCSL